MTIKALMETIENLEKLKFETTAEYLKTSNWKMRKNWVDIELRISTIIAKYKSLNITDYNIKNMQYMCHLFNEEVHLISDFWELKEKNQMIENFNDEGIVLKMGCRLYESTRQEEAKESELETLIKNLQI